MPGIRPSGIPRGAQLDDALGGPDASAGCGRRSRTQPAGVGLEHAVEAGHEHVLRDVGARGARSRARARRPGATRRWRGRAQHAARRGHDEGGRDALVGDVADDDPEPAVGQVDEVVEVAADLARRPVVGGDVPAGQARAAPRQEVLLDQLGDVRAPARSARGCGSRPPARARAGRRGRPARPAPRGSRAAGGRRPSTPDPRAAGRG